jgi:hypothetical protein
MSEKKKPIQFPNANEAQNDILNQIAEKKAKEAKAKADEFDKEKDKEEFLYLWKHFNRRLNKMLKDYEEDLQPYGYYGLEILVKVKKDGADDDLKEQFVYSDRLKLTKITEL